MYREKGGVVDSTIFRGTHQLRLKELKGRTYSVPGEKGDPRSSLGKKQDEGKRKSSTTKELAFLFTRGGEKPTRKSERKEKKKRL